MTEAHIANLSALLEMGEKSLNEGDYVKLANFLKGLRDSQPPNPTPLRTDVEHIETTTEFETLKGARMRVCIHREEVEIFHTGPSKRTIFGSINRQELELPLKIFKQKLTMLYDIHGMKNIKKSVPYCKPIIYKNVGDFKRTSSQHQKDERTNPDDPEHDEHDIDPDDWCNEWLVGRIFSLETNLSGFG
jgi:hypothetical protein